MKKFNAWLGIKPGEDMLKTTKPPSYPPKFIEGQIVIANGYFKSPAKIRKIHTTIKSYARNTYSYQVQFLISKDRVTFSEQDLSEILDKKFIKAVTILFDDC